MSSVLRSDWVPVGWRRDAAIAQLEAQRKTRKRRPAQLEARFSAHKRRQVQLEVRRKTRNKRQREPQPQQTKLHLKLLQAEHLKLLSKRNWFLSTCTQPT